MQFYFFVLSSFIVNCSLSSERIIKLTDLLDDDNYIPIKQGQIFTIEVEGNPSEGKVWSVEDSKRLISANIVKPLNLNKDNTVTFYQSHTENSFSNGFYHFKFKASKRSTGHEEITFVYKENDKIIQKTVNLLIISQPKIDL
jgi:predicted secreted protein